MNAVGVYIYAGGFSLGVRKHFNILAHCEDRKPYGLEVIRANQAEFWKGMPVLPFGRWSEAPGPIDFLYANPPCAPFSNNNVNSYIKGAWKSDPRIKCWSNIVDFAKQKQPKVVAMETVPQAYLKAPGLVKETILALRESYHFVYLVFHNISLTGSLQNRNRLFIVASNTPLKFEDHQFKLPTITVKDRLDYFNEKAAGRKFWSLPIAPQYQACASATPAGGSMRDAFHKIVPPSMRKMNPNGTIKGRPSFNTKRLDFNERVNTLCGFAHIHPTENRYVSVKEYQILADFPFEYEMPESGGSYGYVSRGVSPSAGEWLARIVRESLLEDVKFNYDHPVVIFDGITNGEKPKIYGIDIEQVFPKLKLAKAY